MSFFMIRQETELGVVKISLTRLVANNFIFFTHLSQFDRKKVEWECKIIIQSI